MNLAEYVPQALRTETTIPHVNVNTNSILYIMKIFIAAGNMLDQHKKEIFYGKTLDTNTKQMWIESILNNIQHLTNQSGVNEKQLIDSSIMDPRLFHGVIGLATEATELVEAISLSLSENQYVDKVNIQEELGDINWYISILVDSLGADWNKILDTNIKKLKIRYPDKFTTHDAINRDLSAERKILEDDKKMLISDIKFQHQGKSFEHVRELISWAGERDTPSATIRNMIEYIDTLENQITELGKKYK